MQLFLIQLRHELFMHSITNYAYVLVKKGSQQFTHEYISAALFNLNFRLGSDFVKETASAFQRRNDIRIVASYLYQVSKRASQLREHTLKGDDYAIYRLEIELKLIEAEDLFAEALKIKGIDQSIFKSLKVSSEASKEEVLRENLPTVPST